MAGLRRAPRSRPGMAVLAVVLLLLSDVPIPTASMASADAVGDVAREPLTVVTQAGKRFTFHVEVADSETGRRRGLMYRDRLAPEHGMLFLYDPARRVAMWMKNTLLPLDILFIEPGGRIISIERNAVPLSEKSLRSGAAVRGVLEINGGLAEFLGVAPGDRVVYEPLWPDL